MSKDLSTNREAGNPKSTVDSNQSPEISIGSTDQKATENMEVHKHPHHVSHKKRWGEYLLEFLMIFLAVTLGFFAENIRERVTESHREKEYANVLYTELLGDSIAIANKIARRLEKEKDMDYLSGYFKDSSLTNLPKNVYAAFTTSLFLINSYSFEPKDGILSQLRNSGSLRYFKSIGLQKLLGDISVNINDVRIRNEQEYQFFANPIKPFLLKYYDWSWVDQLRRQDTTTVLLNVINNYRQSDRKLDGKIMNLASFDRGEASNLILFYKQMEVSTRTLQMNNYVFTNHKILQLLRETYRIENE